jgi:hypothetical protein
MEKSGKLAKNPVFIIFWKLQYSKLTKFHSNIFDWHCALPAAQNYLTLTYFELKFRGFLFSLEEGLIRLIFFLENRSKIQKITEIS